MRRLINVKGVAAVVVAVAALVCAIPAAAQGADPNPGAITLTGNMDFVNAYMFRGIPQDESKVIMWPSADLGFALFSGDGAFKSLGINIGTWNSLHTGNAGLDGPTRRLWYESDFYATVGFGFGGGTSVGVTYTAYTSPNLLFSTVKEFAFKFAVDDSGYLGRFAVKPYVLVAREFGRDDDELAAGLGQADGGTKLGTYLELGVAPGYNWRVAFSVPVKVGLSLDHYYEGFAGDETFGYASVAGVVTWPLTSAPTKLGTWNVHGGIEYQRLGDNNAFRLGEDNQVIYSAGIGFTY